jgi:Protein of unknown function (DUF3108)
MRRLLISVASFILLAGFAGEQQPYPVLRNTGFGMGEVIDYRVDFGIFTIGHARTKVEKKIYTFNNRPCYKIDGYGTTSGLLSWLAKIDDQWGAYVDTAALITHVSYRKIKEGRFRKDELVTFDHETRKAQVKVMNKETGIYDNIKFYPIKDNVHDIVAGFTYLRVADFSKMKKGDTLAISGFFEDNWYTLKILYDGKEMIYAAVGKIMCHRLVPVVPDNKLFDGENSITVWLSADKNQLPVRIIARMLIGSTGLELEGFRGLRNQLKIVQ